MAESDLEKQLMDLSGMKPADPSAAPQAPSVVEGTDYGSASRSHIAPVRTFNSDLAEAVRDHQGSVVRVAIAEEEAHRRAYEEVSIKSKKNIAFLVIGTLLVAAGIFAVVYTLEHKDALSVVAPVVTAVPTSIIPSDDVKTVDIAGMQASDLYAAIQKIAIAPTIQSGQIENIILTKTVNGVATRPTASDFLTTIGTHAPSDLLRALSSDYMLGTSYDGTNDSLFLVVHGTANDYLVSGMLEWEPWIFTDLVPLFSIDTSALTKAQLQDMTFSDTIIGNHDARAVLDAGGNPMLYYSFIDPDTILFAAVPKVLAAVVAKYP